MTGARTPIAAISSRTGAAARRGGGAAGRTVATGVAEAVAEASGTARCASPPSPRGAASHTLAAAMSARPSHARFTRPRCATETAPATRTADRAIGPAD
jgi:hypothetical protein